MGPNVSLHERQAQDAPGEGVSELTREFTAVFVGGPIGRRGESTLVWNGPPGTINFPIVSPDMPRWAWSMSPFGKLVYRFIAEIEGDVLVYAFQGMED